MSAWRNLLDAVPITGRPDNVVTLEPSDPHAPPRILPVLYRETSEQNALVQKLEDEFNAFEVKARDQLESVRKAVEDHEIALRAERAQRMAAIAEARRSLEEKQERWGKISESIGVRIMEASK